MDFEVSIALHCFLLHLATSFPFKHESSGKDIGSQLSSKNILGQPIAELCEGLEGRLIVHSRSTERLV